MTVNSGSIRFNTDSSKMEIYNGEKWWEIDSTSPAEQTGGTRGFSFGGYANSPVSAYGDIDYFNMETTGDLLDFGDLGPTGGRSAASSSRTRSVIYWANAPAKNTIEYITVSSTGDAIDFGDATSQNNAQGSCSDRTRSCYFGGVANNPDGSGSGPYARSNHIDYITIAATGNAVDFGDLTQANSNHHGAASQTRGLVVGGATGPAAANRHNTIEYFTISTLGNAADFGDLTGPASHLGAGSNSVRALRASAIDTTPSTTPVNTIDYWQIATLGNAVDFGDMISTVGTRAVSASPTRLVMCAGSTPSSPYNINNCEYVQIATTGNGVDFGDTTQAAGYEGPKGTSNGHGGLG